MNRREIERILITVNAAINFEVEELIFERRSFGALKSALELQVAKKPINKPSWLECPAKDCGRRVSYSLKSGILRLVHCGCGQRIDWER